MRHLQPCFSCLSLVLWCDNYIIQVLFNSGVNEVVLWQLFKSQSNLKFLEAPPMKEPGLSAWFELFSTNVSVLEMRWQHVPSLGCSDTETAWLVVMRIVDMVDVVCVQYQSGRWISSVVDSHSNWNTIWLKAEEFVVVIKPVFDGKVS